MAGFKEFKAKFESDVAFAEKFANLKDESAVIALAKAEGYDLEKLSEDDLDAVAGGCRYPGGAAQRGIDAYKAIKNLIALIEGSNKVY